MTSIDYSIFAKDTVLPIGIREESYDIFISAFNSSERVRRVFDDVRSASKTWIVHSEYGYRDDELPTGRSYAPKASGSSPVDFWQDFFEWLSLPQEQGSLSVGIDITGMMRPHLMLLPLMLRLHGLSKVHFLYSDPTSYASGDATKFSKGPVGGVSVLPGMEGIHRSSSDASDLLIIGAGYDHGLVRAVAESKRSADHYLLVGLPSLQPHMYQESLLRLNEAKESITDFRKRSFLFAPAHDPFMTAHVLSSHVKQLRSEGRAENVYLSPVGAKTQVLGFTWYFLCEARDTSTSMLFPFSSQYEQETSRGIACLHKFEMELDMISL
ncbi:hypothetical protein [Paenarthrobacter nitroguajacolicus]|uniref:hypothetical protein n=1 Tax=Paenarthrobacter nitroguajacolicus TaxID=211146 RepID=UPI00405411D5